MKFLTFDESRDFPYYNHNPRISKTAWLVLLFCVMFSFLMYGIIGGFSEFAGSIFFCFTMLIPLLHYSNWDYSLFLRKPPKNELILAVLMFIGYMVYAIVVGGVLDYFALSGVSNPDVSINWESVVSLVFSMMGEELVKFIPLMFFMRFVYKFTNNRRLAIIISSVIVLVGFGLIHYDYPNNTIYSILILQGLGTVFELYGYLKTKNIFVPYISHILTDATIFILLLSGLVPA